MDELSKEEQAIADRIADLADKIFDVLNASVDEGSDPDEHLAALTFCLIGVVVNLGIKQEDFVRHMYKAYKRMQQNNSVQLLEVGNKNAHH